MIESEYDNVSVEVEKQEILENWTKLTLMAEQRKNALEKHFKLHVINFMFEK